MGESSAQASSTACAIPVYMMIVLLARNSRGRHGKKRARSAYSTSLSTDALPCSRDVSADIMSVECAASICCCLASSPAILFS